MASTTIDAPWASSWRFLAAPLLAIGRFLLLVAKARPGVQELERLSQQSDTQLAARGLTREGELRRILGLSIGI